MLVISGIVYWLQPNFKYISAFTSIFSSSYLQAFSRTESLLACSLFKLIACFIYPSNSHILLDLFSRSIDCIWLCFISSFNLSSSRNTWDYLFTFWTLWITTDGEWSIGTRGAYFCCPIWSCLSAGNGSYCGGCGGCWPGNGSCKCWGWGVGCCICWVCWILLGGWMKVGVVFWIVGSGMD